MSKKITDLTGQKFEQLTVVRYEGRNKHGSHMWVCKCSCGNETISLAWKLKRGRKKSCGCWQVENAKTKSVTHGMSNTPTWHTWRCMRRRCTDPKQLCYPRYGGRGITVCERWLESFENFLADMGERPLGFTLDRIDNSLGYSAENCRWATIKEQQNNTRRNRKNHI